MIHFTKEGAYKRIGLNICRTNGGFVVGWVWYDVENRELYGWRWRLRVHKKPWFIFERNRSSVVQSYLSQNDLLAVNKALLEDQAPYLIKLARYEQAKAEYDGRPWLRRL